MDAHLLGKPLVGCRNTEVDEPLFRKAHAEELQLIVVRDLIPSVIRKTPGEVLEVVCTAAANGWLLPSTTTWKRSGFTRHRHVLWRWFIVVVDHDPLMSEFGDVLCRLNAHPPFDVGDNISDGCAQCQGWWV